jgi:hypothetical protein
VEIKGRVDDIRSGKAKMIPGEEVLREIAQDFPDEIEIGKRVAELESGKQRPHHGRMCVSVIGEAAQCALSRRSEKMGQPTYVSPTISKCSARKAPAQAKLGRGTLESG